MTLTEQITGSIGSIEIDYDRSNNRVKGWIQNNGEIYVLENFTGWTTINVGINEARTLSSLNHATRETLRLVSKNIDASEIFDGIEAVMEFRSSRFDNCSVNYLSRNQDSRLTRESFYQKQTESINEILEMKTTKRDIPDNYNIERLTDLSENDLDNIQDLMRESFTRKGDIIVWYEPTRENLAAMLKNSITYIARDENNNIVSMSIAEHADLNVQGTSVSIYEISNCTTSKNHRNQGLLQNCINTMLQDQELQQADLIYTEARLAHRPILKVFHNLGFEYGGTLRNHTRVGGDRELPEDQNTESLAVFYLK